MIVFSGPARTSEKRLHAAWNKEMKSGGMQPYFCHFDGANLRVAV